jgi:hypothetical protein
MKPRESPRARGKRLIDPFPRTSVGGMCVRPMLSKHGSGPPQGCGLQHSLPPCCRASGQRRLDRGAGNVWGEAPVLAKDDPHRTLCHPFERGLFRITSNAYEAA